MINITELMDKGNITLSITSEDLMKFLNTLKGKGESSPSPSVINNSSSSEEPKYLSTTEVMKRLRVSRTTLWRYNQDGYLMYRKVGKFNRYALEDVKRVEEGCNG